MITDTFIHPPITTNTPREKTDVANERQNSLDNLIETLKVFNILRLQSTINDFADDHSKQMSLKAINWKILALVTERKEKSLILTL